MQKYIAFIQGINVGKNRQMSMAELQKALRQKGLQDVQTYLRSGNVIFSSEKDTPSLQREIQACVTTLLGETVPLLLFAVPELNEALYRCPFTEEALAAARAVCGTANIYFLFFEDPLPADAQTAVSAEAQREAFHTQGKVGYLFVEESIRFSGVAKVLTRLKIPHTARNINTVRKVLQLAVGEL